MFLNRKDAGEKLGDALIKYKDQHPIILAIPRGGTEVGYEVAKKLHADFSLLICRKLPYPHNPESGFGAIAEDGTLYINPYASAKLPSETIEMIVLQQLDEIRRRVARLRGGKPLPSLQNRTVILVDDGIAMGSTMHVAVEYSYKHGAAKVVVAAPVAGKEAIVKFSQMADDVVILESPANFHAVAQVYQHWYDVSDEEVLEILKRWEREKKSAY